MDKEFSVHLLVSGYMEVSVSAKSEQEAEEKAMKQWEETDFSPLKNIEVDYLRVYEE